MPNGRESASRLVTAAGLSEPLVFAPGIDIGAFLGLVPPPVDVVRPSDLVHLRFSFVNLTFGAAPSGAPPVLRKRISNRAAFLVMEWAPQHVVEHAFYEPAGSGADKVLPEDPVQRAAEQAELAAMGGASTNPPLYGPPVQASMAGRSRLAFRVTSQEIEYTIAGLLDAARRLPLSVVHHAPPPPKPQLAILALGPSTLIEAGLGHHIVTEILRNAAPARRVGASAGSTASGRFARAGRTFGVAAALFRRFDAEAAAAFVGSSAFTVEAGLAPIDVSVGIDPGRFEVIPQPPKAPDATTQTAIELPWRLILSPSIKGAWAHATEPVEHHGRFELFHSRLGVRVTKDGEPSVDEKAGFYRTVRAVWARDFDEMASFPFDPLPTSPSFPNADGSADLPVFRKSLNSRDRMMLVHETSNFTMKKTPNGRKPWVPRAVPVNRLMLSSQGGWLDCRVAIPELPEGRGVTLEEWKHIATLGRDHEVKVVYAGFLMPFGHQASLVKVTQRKFATEDVSPAYLYQRMFIVVRQPVRQFRTSSHKVNGARLDLAMPFTSVRIVTEITPDLDLPENLFNSGGYMFSPHVGGSPFGFKTVATDMEGNVVEFDAPLIFVEFDHNETGEVGGVVSRYNQEQGASAAALALPDSAFRMPLGGQRLAFADSVDPDDTALATASLRFRVVTDNTIKNRPQAKARFEPVLGTAKSVVPAVQALTGSATPTEVKYPSIYLDKGFVGAEVFLETVASAAMDFAGQGNRSGGYVTPGLQVSGLSRITGPIGGPIATAAAGQFDPAQFFAGISAKLFGVVPLTELIPASLFSAATVPKFVAQTLNVATTLASNVERLQALAAAHAGTIGVAAGDLQTAAATLLGHLNDLLTDPLNPPDLATDVATLTAALTAFGPAAQAADLSATVKEQIAAIERSVSDQLGDAVGLVNDLIGFAEGLALPDVVNARLDWSTELNAWDPGGGVGDIFLPKGDKKLRLAVEVQAPTKPGGEPNVLVSCSLPPFDLRLIGDSTFLVLHFGTMRFSLVPGKKPDVDIVFDPQDGIDFQGPLEFVDTLKDIIPFDGFSDPPYLDISTDGVRAGFDLGLPSLAIGVFTLENISLGAHVHVPFIDESLEVGFNFCTRENPFRLTVSLFGGGGFFGVTITPDGVRVLEAALEFGAAISVNLGVASGSVSIMAGIYLRIEDDDATLTGYFRMRGEVDVLGLISASIELYLEFTYETATKKAVGRASITVEVEVLFFSASVSISCEKKFAGANGDPSFADLMGLAPGAPPGTPRPWDEYCMAFA